MIRQLWRCTAAVSSATEWPTQIHVPGTCYPRSFLCLAVSVAWHLLPIVHTSWMSPFTITRNIMESARCRCSGGRRLAEVYPEKQSMYMTGEERTGARHVEDRLA